MNNFEKYFDELSKIVHSLSDQGFNMYDNSDEFDKAIFEFAKEHGCNCLCNTSLLDREIVHCWLLNEPFSEKMEKMYIEASRKYDLEIQQRLQAEINEQYLKERQQRLKEILDERKKANMLIKLKPIQDYVPSAYYASKKKGKTS